MANQPTPRQNAYRQWRQAVITAHREGIDFDLNWRRNFAHFLADMGEPPASTKLKRRDGEGPYSPSNCYWG